MYRGEAEFREAVLDFLRQAAAAQEPVLVALPGSHLATVRDELGEAAFGSRFEDIEEVGRNPSRLLAMIEDWILAHDGHARVVSEVVWPGRSYAETIEGLRHEALINQALSDATATILSPYDAEQLDEATLAGAEMTHPTVVEHGRRRPSTSYGDSVTVRLADEWPLESPAGSVSEHRLQGSLRDLRQAVAEDPLLGSLTDEQRSDLVFAVNEAASNAVKHGDQTCTTRLWHDGRGIVSEVSFDTSLEDLMAGRRRPQVDATHGRGLWLINQVCDLVELRSGQSGTTLRMHVHDH
jgi:anti-sigma regulatory factor (Ser/Thr protein kinase)